MFYRCLLHAIVLTCTISSRYSLNLTLTDYHDPVANQMLDAEVVGDINVDGSVNILDAVILVNFVLGFQMPTDLEFSASDLNSDGILNVLDIVQLVNIILDGPLEL